MDIEEKDKRGKKHKLSRIIVFCTIFAFIYALGIVFLINSLGAATKSLMVQVEENGNSIAKEFRYNKENGWQEIIEGTTEQESDTEEVSTEEETEEYIIKKSDKTDVIISQVQTLEDTSEIPLTVVTDVTEVVKTAMPCVVAITNDYTSYNSWYGESVDEESCGSGIIVQQNNDELLIVTNYHVIEDSNTITVTFYDDTDAEAFIKGSSPDDDLAIVSVSLDDLGDETVDSIAIAVLGDSDTLQVGEPAIAIGNSLGYGQSVTTGVISAINRNINDTYLIQTDAAINPGNSGGALLNIRGEVIGINSSKIADYVIEGMGYAIPISTAKPIINELMLNETKKKVASDNRGFLGISGTDVTEDASSRYGMPSGVYVVDVIDDSGAQKAGIEKGDIIVSLDGEKVTSMTGLQGMLEYYEAGTKVTVVLERQNNGDYKEHSVTVTLGKRSEN
jgi:serine protease Do